jgi:hypothetical protein
MENDNLDSNQKLVLDIKGRIETSSHDERQKMLDDLYSKWIVKSDRSNTFFTYLDIALKNFNLDINNLQVGTFERAKKTVIYQLTYLRVQFEKEDLTFSEKNIYEEKFTKLFRSVVDADNAISSSLFLMSSMTLEDIGKEKKTKHDLFRYTEINYDKLNPWQTLLIYLSDQVQRKEYKRYVVENKGICYEKIFNEAGYNTHAWKKAMTIKEFVQDQTRKEYNFAMWQNLTHAKDNLTACVNYLTSCPGPEFEDLNKQRNVYSFNNGIYITKKFDDENDLWKDLWIPFEGPGAIKIGESIVSCKLFNIDFHDCQFDDWFDIIKEKCPHFKSVMEYQRWPEEVQRWLCILIGRMMYPIGELDNWQVMPYLLGMAGTGKSLSTNTPVMLSTGKFKMSQDIEIGDKLMGDDSKPRNVIATSKGPDKLYRVKQVKGDDYIVNGAHVLSLRMTYINYRYDGRPQNEFRIINGKKYRVGETVDIEVDDYLKLSQGQKKALKGYKVPVVFPKVEVPIDPYIIGAWLGDGTSANIGFTNQDAAVLHYLAHKLPEYNSYLELTTSTFGYRFQYLNKKDKIRDKFKELNLLNNKHIPDIYKYNNRENQLKLLAGLLDTDGHYIKEGHSYDFVQKNYTIAKDVEFIARCLGFSSTVVECKKGCMWKGEYKEGTYYRQEISGNGIEDIPCLIPRKKASPRAQIKNNLHTGITVEPVEQSYYDQGPEYKLRYSFQIDGNQRYLLGDHTVTHNSTILENIVKLLYDIEDVGILSNNIEKKFGVAPLSKKKIFIGPEIKGNLQLEQAELQSMISGESMTMAEKMLAPFTTPFLVPGMCAGNDLPNFTDNSGSMTRRFIVFYLGYKIKRGHGDTKLPKKIQAEIAYVIQAANKGYLKTVNENGKTGIWDMLPPFFAETQEEMAENTNGLTHFLNTDLVNLGNDGKDENGIELYCREKVFVAAFNDHCNESHFGKNKWTTQYYAGPFSDFNITVKKGIQRRYPNKPGNPSYTGAFIFGVDVKESQITNKVAEDDDD